MIRLRLLLAVLVSASLWSGCSDGRVTISYQPVPGDVTRYTVTVTSVAITRLGDQDADRTEQTSHLDVTHRVLRSEGDSSDVEVTVADDAGSTRTFVVRLDRAAQLTEVRTVEGLPAEIFGDVGLTELFPAAAGAPPASPLRLGERWPINEPVDLPGLQPSRLTGTGRLTVLGVRDGRDVATVETRFSLPVKRAVSGQDKRLLLDGSQTTFSRSVRSLTDGSVQRVVASTSGHFDVTVLPPLDTAGSPVRGVLDVEVRSTTRLRS